MPRPDLRQHQRGIRTLNKWYENNRKLDGIGLADEAEDNHSGPLSYFDDEKKTRYIPYVIEPSAGVDRSALAFLVDAYDEEQVKGETRNLLHFHPALAPVKVAVFPLVKKEGMPEIAHNIYDDLKKYFNCFYDQKGAVGRRYRRQDEAGTPYCITVDGQTLCKTTPSPSETATLWNKFESQPTNSAPTCETNWTSNNDRRTR